MAFDRYDPRRMRDERSHWRDDEPRRRFESRDERSHWRDHDRDYGRSGRRDERGFFERAGEEIRSWFGDDERNDHPDRSWRDERGVRREHGRPSHPDRGEHGRGGWFEEAKGWFGGSDHDRHRGRWEEERSRHGRFDDRPSFRGHEREDHGYRPMTGDYGRFEQRRMDERRGSDFARNRGEWDYEPERGHDRFEGREGWDRDEHRRSRFPGPPERSERNRGRGFDDDRERGAFFRDEERGHRDRERDRDDRHRERGPHILDRSFSGTYR